MFKFRYSRWLAVMTLAVLASVVWTVSASAGTTNAGSIETKVVGDPIITVSVEKTTVNVEDVASGKYTFLSDVKMFAGTRTTGCRNVVGFINSGLNGNKEIYYFWDPAAARLCPNANSPTGWVKVSGGTSNRNCGNPATFRGHRVPGPMITGKVIMVRSFISTVATVRAFVKVEVEAKDKKTGQPCAKASATGASSVTVNMKMFVNAAARQKVTGRLVMKAAAKATASAECSTTTTTPAPQPTPPPPPTPNPPAPNPPVTHECVASFNEHDIELGTAVRLTVDPKGFAVKTVITWPDGGQVVVVNPWDGGYEPYISGPFRAIAEVTYKDGGTARCSDTVNVRPKPTPPPPPPTTNPPPPPSHDCDPGWQWDNDEKACVPCPEEEEPPPCDPGENWDGNDCVPCDPEDDGGYGDDEEDDSGEDSAMKAEDAV